MSAFSFLRRLGIAVGALSAFVSGSALLGLSVVLLQSHVAALRTMQEQALPLAVHASELEKRVDLLHRQVEASALAADARVGSQEERLHMYVLPAPSSSDRTITLLNGLFDILRQHDDARDVSAIQVGDAVPLTLSGTEVHNFTSRTISFSLTMRESGARDLAHFLAFTGLLNVQDLLTSKQLQDLFALTENESPTGIVSLGQFLSVDLLTYLREPRGFDERFLASFSSNAFSELLHQIQASQTFRNASEMAKGPVGDFLAQQKLWPMPFLAVHAVTMEQGNDGWVRLEFVLDAVSYGS